MISVKASKKTKYLRLYSALTCTRAYLWIFTFEWKVILHLSSTPSLFHLSSSQAGELVFSFPAVGEQLWNAARYMAVGEGSVPQGWVDPGGVQDIAPCPQQWQLSAALLLIPFAICDSAVTGSYSFSQGEMLTQPGISLLQSQLYCVLVKAEFGLGRADLTHSVPLEYFIRAVHSSCVAELGISSLLGGFWLFPCSSAPLWAVFSWRSVQCCSCEGTGHSLLCSTGAGWRCWGTQACCRAGLGGTAGKSCQPRGGIRHCQGGLLNWSIIVFSFLGARGLRLGVNCLRLIAVAAAKTGQFCLLPQAALTAGCFPAVVLYPARFGVWSGDWLCSPHQTAECRKALQESCSKDSQCGDAFTQNGLLRRTEQWSWCVVCSPGGISQMSLARKWI